MADPECFHDRFTSFDQANWYAADYQWIHPAFDTDWRANLVSTGPYLALNLLPATEGLNNFTGASVRRLRTSRYGKYDVVMQPAKGEGLVSGFFLYTGPVFGTRHDEIDIEFLGRDTGKINIAVFVDGQRWERQIDLGFDSADAAQRYGFEWTKDSIRWFAGDRLLAIYTIKDGPIPDIPVRLYSNIWAVSPKLADWAGKTTPDLRGQSNISCISFMPQDKDGVFTGTARCLNPNGGVMVRREGF